MEDLGILELETNPEVQAAYGYFAILRKEKNGDATEGALQFNGYNEYGMVDFFGIKEYKSRQGSDDLDLNSAIEALSNILIAAVLKHAGVSSWEQVKPENWKRGFNEMCRLFFADYLTEELSYNEKKIGKNVVESIIQIAFDLNGEPEGNLKESMKKYLKKQGGLMDEAGYGTKDSILYSMVGYTNYKKSDSTLRICSLRAFFTKFNSETIKISHSCEEPEKKFDFDFRVEHYSAGFMLSNWENNAEFRQRVNKFIKDHEPDTPYFSTLTTAQVFRV